MARCETCGNDYEQPMKVELRGVTHWFDSFECAIQRLAPVCACCGTRVIGHGVEGGGRVYCCAHCARAYGESGISDHAPSLVKRA